MAVVWARPPADLVPDLIGPLNQTKFSTFLQTSLVHHRNLPLILGQA